MEVDDAVPDDAADLNFNPVPALNVEESKLVPDDLGDASFCYPFSDDGAPDSREASVASIEGRLVQHDNLSGGISALSLDVEGVEEDVHNITFINEVPPPEASSNFVHPPPRKGTLGRSDSICSDLGTLAAPSIISRQAQIRDNLLAISSEDEQYVQSPPSVAGQISPQPLPAHGSLQSSFSLGEMDEKNAVAVASVAVELFRQQGQLIAQQQQWQQFHVQQQQWEQWRQLQMPHHQRHQQQHHAKLGRPVELTHESVSPALISHVCVGGAGLLPGALPGCAICERGHGGGGPLMRVLLRVLLLLGAVGLASLVRFGSNDAAIVALLGSNVVLLVILSSRYDSSFHSSLSQLCVCCAAATATTSAVYAFAVAVAIVIVIAAVPAVPSAILKQVLQLLVLLLLPLQHSDLLTLRMLCHLHVSSPFTMLF